MGKKISEVAKNFGLSPEMLRFLEKKGLLSASRSDGSGYREYDLRSYWQLMSYMKYRNIGLSIKDITAVMEAEDSDLLSILLAQRYRELRDEVATAQLLMEHIDDYRRQIVEFDHNLDRCWFALRPGVECLLCGVNTLEGGRYALSQNVVEWGKCEPFVSLGCLLSPDSLDREKPDIKDVFFVDTRLRQALGLPPGDQPIVTDEQLYLCSNMKCHSTQMLLERCRSMVEQAKEQNYLVSGPLLVAIRFRRFSGQERTDFLQIFVPVAKEPTESL